MVVKDIVPKKPIVIDITENIVNAQKLMILNDLQYVCVVDGKKFIGVIETTDFSREFDTHLTADQFVIGKSIKNITIDLEATVQEAAQKIADENLEYVIVLEGKDKFVGVLTPADIIKDRTSKKNIEMNPEMAVIYLAMTRTRKEESYWFDKIKEMGYTAAVTQVGANAIDLPVKLRESAIVAAIAKRVINEDMKEKNAVSNAVRDLYSQIEIINRGLGGGFKLAIIRGKGIVSVAAYGKCGHALGSGPDHIFMGYSII